MGLWRYTPNLNTMSYSADTNDIAMTYGNFINALEM